MSRVLVAHVTNLTPPGSQCNPTSRLLLGSLRNSAMRRFHTINGVRCFMPRLVLYWA
jgi:hypothetical protein